MQTVPLDMADPLQSILEWQLNSRSVDSIPVICVSWK